MRVHCVRRSVAWLAILTGAACAVVETHARELTFDDRVVAQEAIERVRHAHQIGASGTFEAAVPREVLEKQVLTYLEQSAALEAFWHTPVTAEMLRRETDRMAAATRMPDRLRELYAALGNDPLLVEECLARPALVDRLTRNFFAFDEAIHRTSRIEAEELREALARYGDAAFQKDARRTEVEVRADRGDDPGRERPVFLSAEGFERFRARVPERAGTIGPVRDERDRFAIAVVLEERPGFARVANYTIQKKSWDAWWREVSPTLDPGSVVTVGTGADLLSLPAGAAAGSSAPLTCLPDDTWDNGTLDDVPDARQSHTAVWTGSLMIVWGGAGAGGDRNTGGRYDPATDTWSPTSLVGAPSARSNHTAVWTGTEMIVWGGFGGASLDTGGRYDPATDTWTATSRRRGLRRRGTHTRRSGPAASWWCGAEAAAATSTPAPATIHRRIRGRRPRRSPIHRHAISTPPFGREAP
jgi:hypothetical protein